MAYTPIIPGTGLAGWTLLKATQDRQVEVFNKSPDIARDVEYFRENIGNVETLDDFMSDRKLLKVALGAFGLGEEINKGAFVRKVLEGGTTDERAYAVRLNNPDYLKLAGTFAVEDGNLSIDLDTVEKIIAQYQTETFEEQVGTVDETMRLALNFEREIADLAGQGLSENSGWFKVMDHFLCAPFLKAPSISQTDFHSSTSTVKKIFFLTGQISTSARNPSTCLKTLRPSKKPFGVS